MIQFQMIHENEARTEVEERREEVIEDVMLPKRHCVSKSKWTGLEHCIFR